MKMCEGIDYDQRTLDFWSFLGKKEKNPSSIFLIEFDDVDSV